MAIKRLPAVYVVRNMFHGLTVAAAVALLCSCASSYSLWQAGGGPGPVEQNQSPQAALSIAPSDGPAPLTVQHDATASTDLDGTIARYDWDLDGDGTFETADAGGRPPAHVYDTVGVYYASVRVTDDEGATGMATIEVVATGGDPPVDAPALTVEKWQGGATAALSLTFDDGTPEHWSRGMQLWQDYGFRVTLGIIAQTFESTPARLPDLQQAFNAGHELANHSSTHPDFLTLTTEQRRQEVLNCEQLLLDSVVGLDHVNTFVYPYEQFDDTVIAELGQLGYICARSGSQGITDYAEINDPWNPPFMHLYSWANLNSLEMWMWDSVVDGVIADGGWQVEQCHGIGAIGETGVGWSPRPEAEYRAHYNHIASYGDALWIAPMGEVGRYILERNLADFLVLDYTAERFEFIVTDSLNNEIYDVPLTVDMEVPVGMMNISVSQGFTSLTFSEAEAGHIRFDVTPGSGTVVVEYGV